MLPRFSPAAHYILGYDYIIDAPYLFPMQAGRQLIADYYQGKYGAKITLLNEIYKLDKALKNLDHRSQSFRAGFLIGKISDHAVPLVYIREAGEEALLYADSQGHNNKIFDQLKQLCRLPIYSVKDKRQADFYSCAADALVFLRDCTAFDKVTNDYRIPHLLAKLKSRGEMQTAYLEIKLPDALLKTSQQSFFTEKNKEDLNPIIHKNLNLLEFRNSYSFKSKRGSLACSYLREKGLKMADLIEIAFYLNALENELGVQWTDIFKSEFIRQAKFEFGQQGDLTLNQYRAGLHHLALIFLGLAKETTLPLMENTTASSLPKDRVSEMAEIVLQIIHDNEYWKQKTLWHCGIPSTINQMQECLRALPSTCSLAAKIFAVRQIALDCRQSKSLWFLLTTTENRDSMTDDFYKLFTEDWLKTTLFDRIYKDWKKFKLQDPRVPLASMVDYQKARVRF